MENFHHGPDVSEATKVGEPTLVDPKQSSAPDIVRAVAASMTASTAGGNNTVTLEKIGDGTTPPPNAPVPRSDATPGASDATAPAASNDAAPAGSAAGSDMKNDLAPQATPAPALPPRQVNDVAGANSPSSTPQASSSSAQQQAAPANSDTESSSKKKKKKHLLLF